MDWAYNEAGRLQMQQKNTEMETMISKKKKRMLTNYMVKFSEEDNWICLDENQLM